MKYGHSKAPKFEKKGKGPASSARRKPGKVAPAQRALMRGGRR